METKIKPSNQMSESEITSELDEISKLVKGGLDFEFFESRVFTLLKELDQREMLRVSKTSYKELGDGFTEIIPLKAKLRDPKGIVLGEPLVPEYLGFFISRLPLLQEQKDYEIYSIKDSLAQFKGEYDEMDLRKKVDDVIRSFMEILEVRYKFVILKNFNFYLEIQDNGHMEVLVRPIVQEKVTK